MSEKKFEYTTTVTGEIVQIPIERLFSHPNNVRDDVGDVTELAESIKAKGILQNLTVVPSEKVNGYFVVIGNRRLAAAREAGLETLPCVVANMTYAEQIETMLLENIQRTDLTPVEQAAGFQMMIDLGDTVAEISRKTGFGETTIRRRLEVAKLDRRRLKRALGERQISMFDLDRLSQIENVKKRNELLDVIGTENFNRAVEGAIRKQAIRNILPAVKKKMKELGGKEITRSESSSGYGTVRTWALEKLDSADEITAKGADEKWFYSLDEDWGQLTIYNKIKKKAPEKRTEKEIKAEERARGIYERLKTASDLHFKMRRDFAASIRVTEKNKDLILKWAAKIMAFELSELMNNPDRYGLADKLGIPKEKYTEKRGESWYEMREPKRRAVFEEIERDIQSVPKVIYHFLGDNDRNTYYYTYDAAIKRGELPAHQTNSQLDLVYDFLTAFGYEMCDEEKKMQSGDPELFGTER